MITQLTTTRNLYLLFAATIALTAMFPWLGGIYSLVFVDSLSNPETVRQTIAGFSADQRVAHAWITATVDVAYPLAYGLLFAASARRFFPNWPFLVWPGLVVIPVDCLEGFVQVLALTDVVDWLDSKAVLTPLKFGLFLLGLTIMVAGWIAWLVRQVRSG